MTTQQAQEAAARLGLSAWVADMVVVTSENREDIVRVKCVGFSSAELAISEGEAWEEVFAQALRIVFKA